MIPLPHASQRTRPPPAKVWASPAPTPWPGLRLQPCYVSAARLPAVVARGSLHGDPGRQGAGKGRLWVRAELRPPPAVSRGRGWPAGALPRVPPCLQGGWLQGRPGCTEHPAWGASGHVGLPVTFEEVAGSERLGEQPVVTEPEHSMAGMPVPAWEPAVPAGSALSCGQAAWLVWLVQITPSASWPPLPLGAPHDSQTLWQRQAAEPGKR